jgi:hypothetical protein
MPCHAMPCHAMPCHAMPCHAMPCHAMPCHAMPSMPCHLCSILAWSFVDVLWLHMLFKHARLLRTRSLSSDKHACIHARMTLMTTESDSKCGHARRGCTAHHCPILHAQGGFSRRLHQHLPWPSYACLIGAALDGLAIERQNVACLCAASADRSASAFSHSAIRAQLLVLTWPG